MDLWMTRSDEDDDTTRAAARIWVRIGSELAWYGSRVDVAFDLDSLEGRVMSLLARRPAWAMLDLREETGVDRRVMSRLIGRLADQGWLIREGPGWDGRSVIVELTAEGRAVLDEAENRRVDMIADLLGAPSPEEQEAATRMARQFDFARRTFHILAQFDLRAYRRAKVADRGLAERLHELARRHHPADPANTPKEVLDSC